MVHPSPQIAITDGGKFKLHVPRDAATGDSHEIEEKSSKHARRPVPLEEDEYIDTLQTIIGRKYFNHGQDRPQESEEQSITEFQSKYTSEDNDSFASLMSRQASKHREKYQWLSSKDTKRLEAREQLTLQEGKADNSAGNKSNEARPAILDSWRSSPYNALMFPSSGQPAKGVSPPVRIRAENTHVQDSATNKPQSDDAIIQALNRNPSEESEPPKVDGYGFVTKDTFKIQDPPKRESIHQNLLDKKVKMRKQEHAGLNSIGNQHNRVSKSSPAHTPLSPAAARIMQSRRTQSSDFQITPRTSSRRN
uniref:ARAD1C29964p n=1 Tax=Blastobotrys adeninivorans TaxID=409370 RepID=A0A060T8M4_BLAAD